MKKKRPNLPDSSAAFHTMTYGDIYDVAEELGIKNLTEDEIRSVKKMYEGECQWHEVLETALGWVKSERK